MPWIVNLVLISTALFRPLCLGQQCEHCTPSYQRGDADEETSLLQVHLQTSSRAKAPAAAKHTALAPHASNEPAGVHGVALGAHAKTEATDPWRGTDVSHSRNPFTKVSFALAQDCPVFADQEACDEAIWLAGLLSKLTKGKSKDLIGEAGKLLSLESWFQNPAGPAGFFNFLDEDSSGRLNSKELMAYGGIGLMQVIDIDHDGEASREECHAFLRGCAVLFKELPTNDTGMGKITTPAMLKLADTVILESTVATGPASNPFTEVASALEKECPPPADHTSCAKAVALANLLVKLTKDVPAGEVVAKASAILSLWFWFENPQGPAGLFSALDQAHKGALTTAELVPVSGNSAALPEVLKFLDTNNDGKASRAECQSYLRGCVMLVHKLPMLDLASAKKPLPDMFGLADSVVTLAVAGSSPLAWAISMSLATLMILGIMYVHCFPKRSAKNRDKDKKDSANAEASGSDQEAPIKAKDERGDSEDIAAANEEEPELTGPPRIGTMFSAKDGRAVDSASEYVSQLKVEPPRESAS